MTPLKNRIRELELIDLSDVIKMLKQKSPKEVSDHFGFKRIGDFRKFCIRKFISIPVSKMSASKARR